MPGRYSDWIDEEAEQLHEEEHEDKEEEEEDRSSPIDPTMELLEERRRLQEASIPEPLIRSILAKRETRVS